MENLLLFLLNFFNNSHFVIIANILSLFLKGFIFTFTFLKRNTFDQKKINSLMFLMLVLLSSGFIDFGWICGLSEEMGYNFISLYTVIILDRVAWIFFILQYHGMILSLDTLITKDYKKALLKKIPLTFISILFMSFFTLLSLIGPSDHRPSIEYLIRHICSFYLLFLLMPIHLWAIFKELQTITLPLIIKKQCSTLLYGLIIPYLFSDLVNMAPIRESYVAPLVENDAFIAFSTLILTYLLYFCIRRILNIELLSIRRRTEYPFISTKFHVHVKQMIDGLNDVAHINDLAPLVEQLLTKALRAPLNKIHLFVKDRVRETHTPKYSWILLKKEIVHPKVYAIENELFHDKALIEYLKKEKCILYDELEYHTYYAHNPIATRLLALMQPMELAVFVPVFHKEQPVAYLLIERDRQEPHLYDAAEKNLLALLGTHLSLLITMLHKDETELVKSKLQTVSDELHHKHTQLMHIKESIRTFIHTNEGQRIGYFFYKDKQFIPANKIATELLPLNLNDSPMHSITRTCTQLLRLAIEKEVVHHDHIKELSGAKKLFVVAVPGLHAKERKEGALLVMHAHPAAIVAQQLNTLEHMSEWDYLVYLETTKNGMLVNKLLPGSSKYLMPLKSTS